MDGERATDLQNLLQAIKSSDVVECRIELINQLWDSKISKKSELASIVKCLTTFWEDSTCLDESQCMLNKTILHVAAKYLELDISGCLGELLSLGTKASIWCEKHLKMTLTSIDESQEEHSSIFFQLVLDLLSFSAANFSALARSPVLGENLLMLIVEKFISKQLNLTKASISEIKRIPSIASEVLKVSQVVVNAIVRLCREYSHVLDRESCYTRIEGNKGSMDSEKVNSVNHVINLITCTIGNLYELGIVAAAGGGSLVAILNVSWKGVVTLLQLGNGVLPIKANVADIISTLISLATGSLRSAAELWSSLKEDIAVTEAKRAFLPVKFYLINAVRISSQYPCQAFTVYREITLCVLMISTFGISLSKETHLKALSEALTEILEPTSTLLLHTLLNSAEVKQESKLEILDWLFSEGHSSSINLAETNISPATSIEEIFTLNCETMTTARILMLGRVALFLDLLKSSPDLGEELRFGISRKLGWLFDCLIDEDVYSSILVLRIPILYGSGPKIELDWQSMFSSVVHALKTFMIVTSSSLAFGEIESFLLENILHPHFLLWDIVIELWCFLVRHAEIELVNNVIDKLFSLFKFMASSEPDLVPGSALRKMARSICMLLTCAKQPIIDQVYSSITGDDSSSIMYIALLMEGFPLNSLSANLRKLATQRITTAYYSFIEDNDKNLQVDNFRSCSSRVLGAPVYALSSALRNLQIHTSDTDFKTLKFTVAIIHGYRNATDNSKENYCKLLSQTLAIISSMKHLYASDEMGELILELQTLFGMDSVPSDSQLYQCKPDLALFMAGLCHMEIKEVDGSATSSALWELYHMLLRERHWAFIHLAIAAFGYFASRTSCNQLWRFVPSDAALSFNINTGSDTNEETFMSELKAFLEKEVALSAVAPCTKQLSMLLKEGLILKETVMKNSNIDPDDLRSEIMEIDSENQVNKKRKIPDSISEGLALLRSSLKVMGDGLSQWQQQHCDSMEFHEKFSTQLSRLEDVITNLVGLTESE